MFSDYSQRMHQTTAVTTANTRALGFYHRLGFRPLEITEPGETTVTYLGRAL
jgi:hypothetical protein